MIKKIQPIWVHPDFYKRLKSESAMEGLTIIKYTEKLSKDDAGFFKKKEKEKKEFGFRF